MTFIALLFSIQLIALTEADCLIKLEEKKSFISSLQDHRQLKQMHVECTKLLDLLEKCDCIILDSVLVDYKLQALVYSIEFFESLKKDKQKDSLMDIIGQLLRGNSNIAPWANYGYLHYKIKYEVDAKKALEIVKRTERIILQDSSAVGFYKNLAQLNGLKSEIYLKSNNYSLAKASLWSAYAYAKEADKLYATLYGKSWGYSNSILVKLLSLPEALHDTKLVERCLEELVHSKADFYNDIRQHKIILSFFEMEELKSNHLKILMNSISKKPEYYNDLDINLRAARYFSSKNLSEEAIKYYRICNKNPALSYMQSAELNLVKSNIDFSRKDWKSLSASSINWRKNIELAGNFDSLWIKSSFRLNLFKQIKEVSALCLNANEQTNNPAFLSKAVELYDLAIQGIQVFKNEISTDEDRIRLLADLIRFSEQALTAYHKLNEKAGTLSKSQYDNILNYFELNKSFNLLVNQSLHTDKFSLEEIAIKSSYERAIASIEQKIGNDPENNDELNHKLEEYKSKLTDLTNSKQLKIGKMNLRDIQLSLDQEQSILEFFSGYRNLFGLLITKDNISFKMLGSDTIPGLYSNILMYQHLNKDLTDEFNADKLTQFKKYSFDFYHLLIQPFQHTLNKNVVMIADGHLATLAWSSLLSANTESDNPSSWPYLIYDFNFNTQPSAALWLKQKKYTPFIGKFNLISFAPEFNNLKYNVDEAKELVRLFTASKLFIKSNASNHNFNNYAPSAKIIHIASHARSGTNAENDLPRILMANDTLYSKGIEEIKFNTDLAFLSACETGLGKVIHAEGVMSLARAFFGAGVKSVISTLWEVNDRISKDQVIAVYKNLLKGLSKPDAIRIMQMEYISNVQRGQYALPYYWASYQCQGNTDAIFDPPSDYLTKVLGILPIVSFSFIGLTFYLLRKSLERINF